MGRHRGLRGPDCGSVLYNSNMGEKMMTDVYIYKRIRTSKQGKFLVFGKQTGISCEVCACKRPCSVALPPAGLNGRPVCSVRDDWNVTSSLFPHPLLRGHAHRKAAHPPFAFPAAHDLHRVGGDKSKSGASAQCRHLLSHAGK